MSFSEPNALDTRVAADIARDLIELHDAKDTPPRIRRQLLIELRRLEPAVAAAAKRREQPLLRRGIGHSFRAIRTALTEIEARSDPFPPMSPEETVRLIEASLEDIRSRAEYLAGM